MSQKVKDWEEDEESWKGRQQKNGQISPTVKMRFKIGMETIKLEKT
jgi:hypothetical protein